MDVKQFGKAQEVLAVPDLIEIQTHSYEDFLQSRVTPEKRDDKGLEALLREIFPIESYDGKYSLEYIKYELGKPLYTIDQCRQLRLTYGRPFRIWVRLNKEQPIEEEVYLGELPIMIGGGEFIINGAERVIVSQLHRSPGVDFMVETESGDRRMHACRIIPERGSWVEMNVTKKDVLVVRIDQSGKFPVTMFLRAMSPDYSDNASIIRAFYKTAEVKVSGARSFSSLQGKMLAADVLNEETGEVVMESGSEITELNFASLIDAKVKSVEIIDEKQPDMLLLNTLAEDAAKDHESALLRIYARLRPGNPAQIEKAKDLFHEKFNDLNRYRLGGVGRFRMNRKFGKDTPETEQTLLAQDVIDCVNYIMGLRRNEGRIDDIDHLGNRRVRTISELASDEIRKGFLKLRRTVQERMSLGDQAEMTPRTLVNSKTISSSIDYFFGRGELSQVVDQTNPLSQLAHERRLSALGPGGLNRKRAGFEVRDVHISHYGRICPVETPEGSNIGLISNLGIFSRVDDYGFLITPYRVAKNGKVTGEVVFLRADEEEDHYIAPADQDFTKDTILARLNGDFLEIERKKIEYIDVSPRQLVGVSAGLIPFLEHDDANRALMGSNMQRQAVPLIRCQPPIVATGLEADVPRYSGMVVVAEEDGAVNRVTADEVVIGDHSYRLRKFVGLNERTCLNQKPIVSLGEKVKKGQVIADGAATYQGELALGRNVLVGFMPFDGYNYEDAILVSERLVEEDAYTSIHIEEFEVEIRETKLGREEFTRDIPNVSERELANLDEHGIIRVGTSVKPGDILVGKIAPKSKSELTPEEKLLQAIFGRAGEDVKNDSLEVPAGIEGIVIHTERFQRKVHMTDVERLETENLVRIKKEEYDGRRAERLRGMLSAMEELTGGPAPLKDKKRGLPKASTASSKRLMELAERLSYDDIHIESPKHEKQARALWARYQRESEEIGDECEREIGRIRRGDKLPSGVLELVKVYVATKRTLSVGDKMAGRHGNKGVIAKIMPVEDMPYLADGTPLDIVLNPLGVPSRMNVGQILETHLGWAAMALGFKAICPVFDGPSEEDIHAALRSAGLPGDGKVTLFDGRTGDPFSQKVTVGYIYMMKLHHLVDDKVHARATGPYSLITQQPLGGKARSGGQRFGEMEVWALEAYGAAHVLQEILTVKSDDVEGRTKIYESMIKGENTLEAGTPVSFEVLTNEIKGLCLNMELLKRRAAI
jgi:DNA-directed RNA polymerase subunit beta